jgi:hypothetical protein
MAEEDIAVTTVDEVAGVARTRDRPRKLSDYSPTNMPLSEAEIEQDEEKDTGGEGWAPRTTENIVDMKPLPEKPGP